MDTTCGRLSATTLRGRPRVEIIWPAGGGLNLDKAKWGWSPFWVKKDVKRPAPINARVETVMTGKYFKQLWPNGRVLAPADGWFEWVNDPHAPKKQQPYFIRLKMEDWRAASRYMLIAM